MVVLPHQFFRVLSSAPSLRRRRRKHFVCGGLVLSLLLAIPVFSSPSQAQTTEPDQRIEGTLAPGDAQLEDRSYRDIHTFTGQVGETITVTLESPDFDVLLILFDANNNRLAYSDDVNWENTNAFITLNLPTSGDYQLVVNSSGATGQGNYRLNLYRGVQGVVPPLPRAETPELEAQQLMQLGFQQVEAGNPATGLENLQRAENLWAQQNNLAKQGLSLFGIGTALDDLNQRTDAISTYQQALDIFVMFDDRQGQRNTLNNLGETYQALGQLKAAQQSLTLALTLAQEDNDIKVQADTWNNLGVFYDRTGQYAKAMEAYRQALSLFKQLGDQSRMAITLNNLGAIYRNLGQYSQALAHYQDSFAIREVVGDPVGMSTILNNMGEIHYFAEDLTAAEAHYQEALSLARIGNHQAGEATVLNNLGQVFGARGQREQELHYTQQALAIAQEIQNPNQEIIYLNNIAAVYQFQRAFSDAIATYNKQLVLARQAGFKALEAKTLGKLGSVYYQQGELTTAQRYLEDSITLLESLRVGDLSDASKRVFYDTQQINYTILQAVLTAQGKYEQALVISEQSRAQAFVELLTERQSLKPFEQFFSDTLDLEGLRDIAKTHQSTLVEYSIIDTPVQSPTLLIWVIQPTGQIDFRQVILDETDLNLSQAISQSREAIGRRYRGGFNLEFSTPSLKDEHLRQLYQILIAPIQDLLPDNPEKRVTFIPQGEIFMVPFPALIDEAGDYLIENQTISVAPSIESLALTQQQQRILNREVAATEAILAIGDPLMPEIWDSRSAEFKQLTSLPGAHQEAQEIAASFNTEARVGAQATEYAVKQRMGNAQIIHLATHGLLEYGNPQASGVQDIPGAIALTPGRGEDGLLTATEIMEELTLKAEMVVLSACDTGLGDITGDGVVGLARSLFAAGTPSVIVSLWSVPDAPTAELMTEFYAQLRQGKDKAQALRQAMLKTIETNPNPSDWAAFTLIGEAESLKSGH